MPAKWITLPYTEALGRAELPLVRPHQGGRPPNLRLHPALLRGVPQQKDMRCHADPTSHVYHGAEQWPKRRHTSTVSHLAVRRFSQYFTLIKELFGTDWWKTCWIVSLEPFFSFSYFEFAAAAFCRVCTWLANRGVILGRIQGWTDQVLAWV